MSPSDLIPAIYKCTLEFLEERGYISRVLRASNTESIDDRMNRVDIKSNGLDIVDAVNCVLDRNRTFAFMNAIERSVKPGDFVIEAGVGTGILAVFAAALNGDVCGIEINKETIGLAKDLAEWFIQKRIIDENNIQIFLADASLWEPSRKANVIISENISTGMFYEMQIPIVNHLLGFLESSGQVVPQSMQSYIILANTRLPEERSHGESFTQSEIEGRLYKFSELSCPILYDNINFFQINAIECQVNINIPVIKSGNINSLLIYSQVAVASDILLRRRDMTCLGEDNFIVIDPPLQANKGSTVNLKMVYNRGSKTEEGFYAISII